MSDITLTASQRSTLQSLSQVTALNLRTQSRLNTGKKVNSAADNAVAYFRAQSLSQRATSFSGYKSNIDQSIQSVQTALTATNSVATLLNELKGVVEGADGASLSQRQSATTQFNAIGLQLAQLVKDATYQGLNLLAATAATLSTQFSNRTAATFVIKGYNLVSTKAGGSRSLFTDAVIAFLSDGAIVFSNIVGSAINGQGKVKGFSSLDVNGTAAGEGGLVAASVAAATYTNTEARIDLAISNLQGISASLGTNVALLQARSTFSANYTNALQSGADALTLADLNVEAANSQALELRQQLGIQSLSITGSQNQSIVSLLSKVSG